MASSINASTAGAGGVITTADNTGILNLQTAGTTAVTVDASQNVGIGTTSPQAKFDTTVSLGSHRFTTNGSDLNYNIRANSGSNCSITWTENGQADRWTVGCVTGQGYLAFRYNTANMSGGTEAMRIDSSGNVLVAGTSYTYGKVTSGGSINPVSSGWANNASFAAYGSYGGGILVIDTGSGTPKGYGLWAQNNGSDFYIKGNLVGSTPTGGVYLANNGTSWSSASDENVKDIIEPITNAVDKVSGLRAVIGKYKYEEDGVRHPFLIAQDVQKVLPESISIMNKGEEGECLGLSYTDTIPLLVAAIKELKAIVDAQQQEINALKGVA